MPQLTDNIVIRPSKKLEDRAKVHNVPNIKPPTRKIVNIDKNRPRSTPSRSQNIQTKMEQIRPFLMNPRPNNRMRYLSNMMQRIRKFWKFVKSPCVNRCHNDDDDENNYQDLKTLRLRVNYVSRVCPLAPTIKYSRLSRRSSPPNKRKVTQNYWPRKICNNKYELQVLGTITEENPNIIEYAESYI